MGLVYAGLCHHMSSHSFLHYRGSLSAALTFLVYAMTAHVADGICIFLTNLYCMGIVFLLILYDSNAGVAVVLVHNINVNFVSENFKFVMKSLSICTIDIPPSGLVNY